MPKALIIVPVLEGSTTTGDQVVVQRLLAFLKLRYDCTILGFERGSRIHGASKAILQRIPPGVAYYWNNRYRLELRRIWSEGKFEAVFILHEGLFYLADELDAGKVSITLFAHNILSRFTVDSIAQPVFTALARRYQRRWYGKKGVRLALISRGDREEAVRLGLTSPDAPVVPPGAPPQVPLSPDARFEGEAVITGTYGWWRKQRDLVSFTAATDFAALIAFDRRVSAVGPRATILDSLDAVDWSSAMRAGIITDQFAGGFKLKSLEYVARNCLVLSRAPISAEFWDLPHASEFIIDHMDENRWAEHLSAVQGSDQDALRSRFLEFKSACMERCDWARCLEPLVP